MFPSAGESYFTSILEELVSSMFVKLKMGRADWTIPEFVVGITTSEVYQLNLVKQELDEYVETVKLANNSNIKLKKKYYLLTKLWPLLNPLENSPDLT